MPTQNVHPQRRALITVLAVTATLALAACGSSSSSSRSASSSSAAGVSTSSAAATAPAAPAAFPNYATYGPPKFTPPAGAKSVALLLPNTEVATTASLLLGFQQAAKKDNIRLTAFNAGNDVATQVAQLETAISEHPNAIVVVPTSPVALNAGIASATRKGILVLGALIPPSAPQVAFALFDPVPLDAAHMAIGLAKAIGGKGDIYTIIGGAGIPVSTLTLQGTVAALKQYPQIKIVYAKDFPGFSPSDAQTAVENGLVAHPNVAGIITDDTSLAAGAYRALATAGKGTVPVVGIGPSTQQDIQYLRTGKITLAISSPFYEIGSLTLQWGLYILAGHKPKQKQIPIPSTVTSKSNIDQAISSGALFKLLAPVTIGCGPGQAKQC